MQLYKVQKPFIFTIFGASGDLAKLKIFPSLYSLIEQKRLPKDFYIVGFARSQKTQEQFKQEFEESIKAKIGKDLEPHLLKELSKRVYYFQGQYTNLESFKEYKKYLKTITGKANMMNICYLSVPPAIFKPIIQNLGESRHTDKEDVRLVIEKPFGNSAASARELFHFIAKYFDENSVYLLDHYLGKSAVQSILHLRHSNHVLNILMKGPEIANIQITAIEDFGVEDRVGYFDQVGIIRDMLQSHLLQILAFMAMSIPITEEAHSVHREKNNILSSLKFIASPNNLIIGQYNSYHQLPNVKANTKTETFAAIKLFIDRESWYRTPIYIRTGKKLNAKKTAAVIEFKKSPFQTKEEDPNLLVLEIHPEERLSLKLIDKHGASKSVYKSIKTSQSIACSGDDCLPEHALLLLDVIRGRKLYFLCFPEIIAAWEITEAILKYAESGKVQLHKYKEGSHGPKNFKWHELE